MLDLLTATMMAFGLAMDAFAVAVSNGMAGGKTIKLGKALLIGFFFGIFQAGMPLIGYFAGSVFTANIQQFDHYIALILLSFIGIKMIVEAIREMKQGCDVVNVHHLSLKMLLIQSIATSIDALAVGVTLSMVSNSLFNVFISVAIIGIITFGCSVIGVYLGKKCSCVLKQKAEILGGVVLILIGLKIFIGDML